LERDMEGGLVPGGRLGNYTGGWWCLSQNIGMLSIDNKICSRHVRVIRLGGFLKLGFNMYRRQRNQSVCHILSRVLCVLHLKIISRSWRSCCFYLGAGPDSTHALAIPCRTHKYIAYIVNLPTHGKTLKGFVPRY
jgi:hypothetical protein